MTQGANATLPRAGLAGELSKLPAFLRRDLLIALSYRVGVFSDAAALVSQMFVFFFIGKLIDASALPTYGGIHPSYLEFVTIGIVLNAFVQVALTRMADALRTEQMIGTLEALPPAHHALVLTAHAWAHRPLGKVGDLLDIALVASHAESAELDRLAAAWGLRRVWRTTARAIDALLGTGPRPASLALWAPHLAQVRERTVLESHLERWLSPLWGLPGGAAVGASITALREDLLPSDGEGWRSKRARVRAAVGNASVRKSQHDEALASGRSAG